MRLHRARRQGGGTHVRGGGLLDREPGALLGARSRGAASHRARRVRRVRGRGARERALAGGDAEARGDRLQPDHGGRVVGRQFRLTSRRGTPARPRAHVGAPRARRQRVRSARGQRGDGGGPQRDEGARGRGWWRRAPATRRRQLLARRRGRAARPQVPPHPPARGPELRALRARARVAEVASPYRLYPREGLVIHTVTYEDQGRERPILYRASVADMVVPYGDPRPTYFHRNAFDVGEYGMGTLANVLANGCDCLGEIRYLDAVVNDSQGRAVTLPNAVCLHEEDAGILWKHFDWRLGTTEVRRSRRLVVSSISTVGNYEYGFYWSFYQDGAIELQVKMTGVISNGAEPPGAKPIWGELVAPQVYGPIHQHFFNARLDVMVDGLDNSVYEVNTVADPPGPDNPHHNAFHTEATLLGSEGKAQRLIDPLVGRFWKIVNPSVRNRLGEPVAYKLMPGENVRPFAGPDAAVTRRAAFMTKHLWVTHHDPRERYAAGDYPNQHPGGAGLPSYVADDAPLENTDLVVWYTFGAHHVVRPEDWPVMPVTPIGFMLKPSGFFDRNPALDVPRPTPHGACATGESACHAP